MSVTGKPPGEETLDRLSAAAVSAFEEAFRGEAFLPRDDGYDEARRVWNGMIEKYPAIVDTRPITQRRRVGPDLVSLSGRNASPLSASRSAQQKN